MSQGPLQYQITWHLRHGALQYCYTEVNCLVVMLKALHHNKKTASQCPVDSGRHGVTKLWYHRHFFFPRHTSMHVLEVMHATAAAIVAKCKCFESAGWSGSKGGAWKR